MKLRNRLADESGFTLSELLIVLVVMGIIIGALAQLFVSASKSQLDQANRFHAQQEARLALDSLRREIHCANGVTSTQSGGGWPSTAVKIDLGSYCATSGGSATSVTWCTQSVSAGRYKLRRVTPALGVGAACAGGVQRADHLTTGAVFPTLVAAGSCLRAKLSVSLPVDVTPVTASGLYTLQDDIVLRNTSRGTCP